jgi:hypothetical protein
MATIKIDRGFTQKIQQKGLSHTIGQPVPPSHKPKKAQSGAPWLTVALVAVGVAVLAVVVGIVVAVSTGKKKASPRQVAQARPAASAQAAFAAATPAPAERPADEPVVPVDESAAYANYQPTVRPAGSSQQAIADARSPQPIYREVPVGSPHGLLCEYYEKVDGHTVDDLRKASKFPNQPDRTVQVGNFELSERLGEHYGARVRGYVVPPATGLYTFVMNVDDGGEFWLSTDESPANKRRLISLTKHTQHKWNFCMEQQSSPCELVAGRRYYLETLMLQCSSGDYLAMGWFGPVSDKIVIIDARHLRPWTDRPTPVQALASALAEAASRRQAREEAGAALAAARAAVEAQKMANGVAHRYDEAARVLKAGKTYQQPAAQGVVDDAVARFEALAQLKAFVQADIARTRPRGVWTAFGGQADVTAANDEGVTVAPGRIVEWNKVPADQLLRLIHATVPNMQGDAHTRGSLLLAAAVYCQEVNGGVKLALKYRESALAASPGLTATADRLLGGSPEALLAEPLAQAALDELAKLSEEASALADRVLQRHGEVAALAGTRQQGLLAEFWDNVEVKSLDDLRSKGITRSRPPDASLRLANFETPTNRADRYVARITGYLTPKVTGDYYFHIASDDGGEFWLSPGESLDLAKKIVNCTAAVGRYAWDREERRSEAVRLEAGTRYAVKGLLREGGQSDHFEVAWSRAAEDKPKLITGDYLSGPSGLSSDETADAVKLAESEAERALALAAEAVGLCEPDDQADSAKRADAFRKQAARVKEALREVEACVKRIDEALAQLKSAGRSGG